MLRIGLRLAAAGLITTLLIVATSLERVPAWLLFAYISAAAVSALFYWNDKSAAQNGGWRTPESTLLGIDLIGGIVGGLLAQVALRHKTSKPSYGSATALVAAIHVLGLAVLALGVIEFP